MFYSRFPLVFLPLLATVIYPRSGRSQAVDPIVIKGSKFFYQNNGSQFFIKGLIYQPSDADSGSVSRDLAAMEPAGFNSPNYDYLVSDRSCSRDIPFLQQLQTNVVRTYGIDPSGDHSGCMTALGDAGMYVLADLMTPGLTITTTNPVWNDVLYDYYTSVIDAMHSYSNMLGFVIGDDVVTDISTNASGPYLKAAVRDMKAYIRQKNYRPIPVGYVGSLYQRQRLPEMSTGSAISSYLNCGNQSDTIDFLGVNLANYESISDSLLCKDIRDKYLCIPANYSVPTFIASYGWLSAFNGSGASDGNSSQRGRPFSNISILFGEMSSIWSGGLIYQFIGQLGVNGYGLVLQLPTDRLLTSSRYDHVSSQMALVSPSSIERVKYSPTNNAATCPTNAAASLPPNPKAVVSPTSPQSTPSQGLSVNAKIGIGTALILIFLALGTVLFLLLRARKKKRTVQERNRHAHWTRKELAADDIDREARGYGPHMAASTPLAEVEDTGFIGEVSADDCQIFEAPGDVPALPEPLYKSFEQDLLARFNELAG